MEKALTKEGYKVISAADGMDAVQLLQTKRPDLAIVDMNMPHLSGLDVIKMTRNFDKKIPFIMVSALMKTDVKEQLRLYGVRQTFKKPVDINDLCEKIKQLLQPTTTVLVADDDDAVRMMFCEFLRDEGYNVISAEDGYHAIRDILYNKIDLVFLDLNMPGLDGIEVLRTMRKNEETTKVIVISAYGDDKTREDLKKFDISDFIDKPVELETIRRKTYQTLGSHKLYTNEQNIIIELWGNISNLSLFKFQTIDQLELNKNIIIDLQHTSSLSRDIINLFPRIYAVSKAVKRSVVLIGADAFLKEIFSGDEIYLKFPRFANRNTALKSMSITIEQKSGYEQKKTASTSSAEMPPDNEQTVSPDQNKYVLINHLKVGMQVAESLYNEDGSIILKKGTILTPLIIRKLKNTDIKELPIKE